MNSFLKVKNHTLYFILRLKVEDWSMTRWYWITCRCCRLENKQVLFHFALWLWWMCAFLRSAMEVIESIAAMNRQNLDWYFISFVQFYFVLVCLADDEHYTMNTHCFYLQTSLVRCSSHRSDVIRFPIQPKRKTFIVLVTIKVMATVNVLNIFIVRKYILHSHCSIHDWSMNPIFMWVYQNVNVLFISCNARLLCKTRSS